MQVAINWTICKGAVPIPGAKSAKQAKEAAGVVLDPLINTCSVSTYLGIKVHHACVCVFVCLCKDLGTIICTTSIHYRQLVIVSALRSMVLFCCFMGFHVLVSFFHYLECTVQVHLGGGCQVMKWQPLTVKAANYHQL